jgi:hypothetical protein
LYLPCELPGAEADGTGAGNNGAGTAHNGEAHAEASEALQLQPAVPDDAAAGGRRLLVLEGARGGLLTLLAYSAVSDLTGIHGPVHVGTAVSPEQGIERLVRLRTSAWCSTWGSRMRPRSPSSSGCRRTRSCGTSPVLAHTRDKIDSAQGQAGPAALRRAAARAAALARRAARANHPAPVRGPA